MTDPKQVSDFAEEYQNTYIALVQYKSANEILFKERDDANGKITAIAEYCTKNGYNDLLKFIDGL